MHHELRTNIEIQASPDVVWEILTDLDAYSKWNPFVTSSTGVAAVGEELTNRLEPPEGKAMTFKPTVTAVESGRVFEWTGHLGFAGIFDGRHRFEIEPTATGTLLRQEEFFEGILVRLMRGKLDGPTRSGFDAMNEALKARAEDRDTAGS